MQYMGDTKAGTLIAKDRYGNKYYENVEEELPRRSFRHPRHSPDWQSLTISSADTMGRLQGQRVQPVSLLRSHRPYPRRPHAIVRHHC